MFTFIGFYTSGRRNSLYNPMPRTTWGVLSISRGGVFGQDKGKISLVGIQPKNTAMISRPRLCSIAFG